MLRQGVCETEACVCGEESSLCNVKVICTSKLFIPDPLQTQGYLVISHCLT